MGKLEGEAAVQALQVRRELGLGESEPIRDIAKLLRSLANVTIIWRPLSDLISGCFIRGEHARVILVNSARTLGHQNFTLAHEYYHLRFEPELTGVVCSAEHFGAKSISERAADLFAAHFMMPEMAIKHWVFDRTKRGQRALNLMDLVDMEYLFGVSHQAMLFRMESLGLLSRSQVDLLKAGVTQAAYSIGYDGSLYRPTNESRMESEYARLAKEALTSELISRGKYEELLLEAGLGEIVFGSSMKIEGQNGEV